MGNKLFVLLFMLVVTFSLSIPVLAQEGSASEESKETPAQEKAEKKAKDKSGKQARWEGVITRSNKDNSTLTIRQRSSGAEKTVHYDSATQWVAQEHGSKKTNSIDSNDVKDSDRVICLGNYDDKGEFHATLISKRLTEH